MTPQELAAAASCYSCLTPEQQLAAQTYLLSLISGGSASGPYVLKAGDTMTGDLSVPDLTVTGNGALSDPAFSVTGTPITGGTATTTKPLALIETAGAASAGWTTSGTMLGVNAPSGFGGVLYDFQLNGTSKAYLLTSGNLVLAGNLSLGSATADLILRRAAAANLALGAPDAASPVAQTISVQSVAAGTTDTAGANFTQKMSASTGTGLGGQWILQLTPPGSTGSSQNAYVTALYARTSTGSSGAILRVGNSVSGPDVYAIAGSTTGTSSSSGLGLGFYNYLTSQTGDYAFSFTGANRTPTSGTSTEFYILRTFAPTSGTAVHNHLHLVPVINQTGGANGITRGLYINPTLTSAADFRALDISDGNVVLPKTVTAGGTTGNQTINKLTGSVNFAAGATSLTVTNSYVTTSSIILATVATNDATMKSVLVVASAGSFVIHANAAATAETRVNWRLTN